MKVIVQLAGGLGNQLFQYAMGRALALRYNVELVLDARTGFSVDRLYQRSMELDAFHLHNSVHCHSPSSVHIAFNRIRHHLHSRGISVPGYIHEEQFADTAIPWSGTRRLLGYWQSEKLCADQEGAIRADLQFKDALPETLKVWEHKLKGSSSVAVHVRRVQYTKRLSLEYYKEALELVKRSCGDDVSFFFFSDDPDWCQMHLADWVGGTVVSHPETEAIYDFRLMSLCKHFVIANSTFSWWSAWIGEDKGSKIFAPSHEIWDHQEILPERWLTIPAKLGNGVEI